MKNCIVCGKPVEWGIVKEDFEELLSQSDALGTESLTELQQCVTEGLICSEDCYYNALGTL